MVSTSIKLLHPHVQIYTKIHDCKDIHGFATNLQYKFQYINVGNTHQCMSSCGMKACFHAFMPSLIVYQFLCNIYNQFHTNTGGIYQDLFYLYCKVPDNFGLWRNIRIYFICTAKFLTFLDGGGISKDLFFLYCKLYYLGIAS